MNPSIIVTMIQDAAVSSQQTKNLVHAAQFLATKTRHQLKIVVAGESPEKRADEVAREFGCFVIALTIERGNTPLGYALIDALAALLPEHNPSHILFAHDETGQEAAPALAVDFAGSLIPGVIQIHENMSFSRAIANARFVATIEPQCLPCCITIQPGTAVAPTFDDPVSTKGEVVSETFVSTTDTVTDLGTTATPGASSDFTSAQVIVAGGRGFRQQEDLSVLPRVADHFNKGAVAGSRPMIDQGWMPYHQQVGITGALVTPELYLACGISGSTQHLAGMKDSKCVVAINNDPNAAIFNAADYGIVDDVVAFLEVFDEVLSRGGL